MTTFEPRVAGSTSSPPDQTKHVNFTLGMVLGEDDFRQEFAYLAGRDQWSARDLLGYGTACGLRVTIENDENGPQVAVTAGAAVSPRGQLIRVKPTQCAYLNDWLALDKNRTWLGSLVGTTATVRLFVVLSYRECRTDQVPIPGEPCRSEEESMAASRVADDFRLELSLEEPDQREEDALRDFVAWLSEVVITDEGPEFSTLAEFLKAIRDASAATESQPDFMHGSPPADLRVSNADAPDFLRAAFRVWVTELRPLWRGAGQTPESDLPAEESVLLAELSVPIVKVTDTVWEVSDITLASVKEERRPYLLHQRMLQECLLGLPRSGTGSGGGGGEGGGGGGGSSKEVKFEGDVNESNDSLVVVGIRGKQISGDKPQANDLLTFSAPEDAWRAAPLLIQGQPVAPPPNVKIPTGQVLTFIRESLEKPGAWQAAPFPTPDLSLEGDVIGSTVTGTTVMKLRGKNIADPAVVPPQEDQVLIFKGGTWTPGTAPSASTPAGTVVNETTFGQASAVGTSTQFSRADHTHGTPPLPTLNGEVTGALASTKVGKLMGIPLAAVGKLSLIPDGAVLTFRSGEWKAEAKSGGPPFPEESLRAPEETTGGNFVSHPAAGPYAIVAAGIVRGDGKPRGPVYNDLSANATGNGRLTVTFRGFTEPPNDKFQYIVKALAITPADGPPEMVLVNFDRFQTTSFVLRVTDGVNPVERGQLEKLEFMIEISRFDVGEAVE